MDIGPFSGDYRYLSNFFEAEVYGYPTNEHFFQAMKSTNKDFREAVKRTGSPTAAKRLGRNVQLRSDWEQIKDKVMLTGLRYKFTQHPRLGALLVATKKVKLVELNRWHDNEWGHCTCSGCADRAHLNKLGEYLMIVRREIS